MKDCAKDILTYHDQEVTLQQAERDNMRTRRDANRDRLKKRLKDTEKPTPLMFIKQGSFAMKTMVQEPDNDYDIDDGVYFSQDSLKGPNGGDMQPRSARQMVCDALNDNRFNQVPEVRLNCVRVYYEQGYHVDLPVYRVRESDGDYELASGSDWTVSRAADVENWFNTANQNKSPDQTNGRQFRRIVRLLKKFARSRNTWKGQIASGFAITILAEEQYVANQDREDTALRNTMWGMCNRLLYNLEVYHPVTPGQTVTNGPDDAKMRFLRDKLTKALEDLEVLDDPECSREAALKAWDKVFGTSFFIDRYEGDDEARSAQNAAILGNLIAKKDSPPAVDKKGGGRFA